jgi:hypothetical protein
MKRFLFFLIPILSIAQFEVSGNITPRGQFYLDSLDTHIDLPFRIGELEANLKAGDFYAIASLAIETRWDSIKNPDYDLREAYVSWVPSFGEIMLGKQIIPWGAADGNNPTDNLQPYNFYYLFNSGTDRKNGSFALNSSVYLNNLLVQAVVLPFHESNTLIKSTDPFPENLKPPRDFTDDEIFFVDGANELELGIRIRWSGTDSDFGFYYFSGNDRNPSPYEFAFVPLQGPTGPLFEMPTKLGFRKTLFYGLDGVSFWGDFTFRFEGAYFQTHNSSESQYDLSADYYQTVLQLEYSTPWDITVTAQYIQSATLNLDFETHVFPKTSRFVPLDIEDAFMPGMGTPFAMITNKSIMLMSSTELFDSDLELGFASLIDLEETGAMVNISVNYLIEEKLELGLGTSFFKGENTETNNFHAMESFSNASVNLSFKF